MGQTARIRHRAQSDKWTDWQQFTHDQPLLHPSLFPTWFLPSSLPVHVASSVCIVAPTLVLNIQNPQVCILISCKGKIHLL